MKQIHLFKNHLALALLLMTLNLVSYSQNSISISNSSNLSLNFTSSINPGAPLNQVTDNSKWLNYNILVTPPEPGFSIAVSISSGTMMDGMELKVAAGSFTGTGGGQPGIPMGPVILTNVPQIIISNIGTCNTGQGVYLGHQLIYTLDIKDYSRIRGSAPTINIVYSIVQ